MFIRFLDARWGGGEQRREARKEGGNKGRSKGATGYTPLSHSNKLDVCTRGIPSMTYFLQ